MLGILNTENLHDLDRVYNLTQQGWLYTRPRARDRVYNRAARVRLYTRCRANIVYLNPYTTSCIHRVYNRADFKYMLR